MPDSETSAAPIRASDALQLTFDRYLSQLERGDASSFEEWVAERPPSEHAELRQLHSEWRHGMSLLANRDPAAETEALGRRLLPGTRIADFCLVRPLGRGGQGSVWEAEQLSLGRRVALKLLRADTVDRERLQRSLDRFRREARAGARLRHRNLVSIFQWGEDADLAWIAQELVPGGRTLKHRIDEVRSLPQIPKDWSREIAGLLAAVAEGLSAAHELGIVHRDVKPTNILLEEDGTPRLGDFGLAFVRSEEAVSASEQVPGTLLYMSPEQVGGRRAELDQRSDVFSLGVVCYELLTLRRPFEGDSVSEIARKIEGWDPPDPRTVRAGIPRDLALICNKALEKDPKRRFQTAADFAADLRRWLANEPVHARPPTLADRTVKWVKRNPTKSVAAGIVTLAFAAITWLLIANVRANDDLSTRTGELEVSNKALAAKTTEAQVAAAAERRKAEEVLRLSALQEYDDLMTEAAILWPPFPEKIEDCKAWIDRAGKLVGELAVHRAKRDELQADALALTDEERRAERESHPDWPRPQAIPAELEELGAKLVAAASEENAARIEQELWALEEEQRELEGRVSERRNWRFTEEHSQSRWLNNQLTKLIEELEGLTEPRSGLLSEGQDAVSAEHGWSVPRRLGFAERVRDGFAQHGEFDKRWQEVMPEIRAAYPGLELAPQMGLVPIGPDPDSGLWEFAELATGELAVRRADGKLVLTEEMGLVFVLLPGGTFWMGAQSTDRTGPNYDSDAAPNEGPPREVTLSAFFLSKYEMTQAQWQRLSGDNPSRNNPKTYSRTWNRRREPGNLLHPVEQVSWYQCTALLERLGLSLPSEAQWEYAARAGTQTVWWCGGEGPIVRSGNVADRYGKEHGAEAWSIWNDWDDGNTSHARVGSYEANAFGLHDVIGNVSEWCADPYVGSSDRVYRGGSFATDAVHARSAYRFGGAPSIAATFFGLRPARGITP